MKFCERTSKFSTSRLKSALHNFGNESSTSLKVTATSSMKKMKKGKIFVQPEAVKRRKYTDGSRRPKVKGMDVKYNPFVVDSAKKRVHRLATNIANNETVAKKAGRTMASKTKLLAKKKCTTKKEC